MDLEFTFLNTTLSFDIRADFPIFRHQPDLVYLDSAASSQRPQSVIGRMQRYESLEHANVHRGIYRLSEAATSAYEGVRKQLAEFLGGVKPHEVVFSSGTTDSINLVSHCLSQGELKAGDEVLVTVSEHHSNIVPWYLATQRVGAKLRFIPLGDDYRLDIDSAEKLINPKTKVLAFSHISNVLGTIQPVAKLVELAKQVGAITVVDGAQGMAHLDVDVRDLACDFYAFSSHKMLGPTGVGALYGREELLERLPPYRGGGDMISSVTTEGCQWAPLPAKFEAGTPSIAGVIGLGEALRYWQRFDRVSLLRHDRNLASQAVSGLRSLGVTPLVEGGDDWVGIVSFVHPKVHPHDIASILDSAKVCVRAGHHCAQPLMQALGCHSTTRLSPYLYNTAQDIERFLSGMEKVEAVFG